MSYQNLIMYFKTIPSYDSDDESKKSESKEDNEESVDLADLGEWIPKKRAENKSKR